MQNECSILKDSASNDRNLKKSHAKSVKKIEDQQGNKNDNELDKNIINIEIENLNNNGHASDIESDEGKSDEES